MITVYIIWHGNVSEWVLDVYRPMTSKDADEFRPLEEMFSKQKYLILLEQSTINIMLQFMMLMELSNILLNLKLKDKIRLQRELELMDT